MTSQNLKYTCIEGIPTQETLKTLLEIYASIFEDALPKFFIDRITTKEDIVSIICFDNKQIIGFKIGYLYNKTTFYSWVGGVLSNYRRQGIAQELANKQIQIVKEKGYIKLRTKSMNRFKPMLLLNIKNGFDIIQVYTNEKGQRKIVFEKDLKN